MKPAIQKAVGHVREKIRNGSWSQNERIPPVRILAREAQVSTAAMNAALSILRDEGIVSIVKNRGAYLGAATSTKQNSWYSESWTGGQRWHRLKTQIENDIFNGYYTPGESMPSLRDLEKFYSVSYKTLRKALESISDEGIIVPSKKTYQVPALRKAHATLIFISAAGASSKINFGGFPHTQFLSALRRESGKSMINVAVLVYNPERRGSEFSSQLRMLREKHSVLGYVLWGSLLPEHKLNEVLQLLQGAAHASREQPGGVETSVAVVDIHADTEVTQFLQHRPGHPARNLWIFSVAGIMAGRHVGQYLMKLGHRKVVFLSYCHQEQWSQYRYRGLLQAFQNAGFGNGVRKLVIEELGDHIHSLPASPSIQKYIRRAEAFLADSAETGKGRYAAYALEQMQGSVANYVHQLKMAERTEPILTAMLEDPDVTACVAANDRMALLIRDHLERKGIRVPKDISVISFDDSKAATDNDLSSYSFALPDIARKVLAHVLSPRSKRPVQEEPQVECEGLLVDRGSSGPARNKDVRIGVG